MSVGALKKRVGWTPFFAALPLLLLTLPLWRVPASSWDAAAEALWNRVQVPPKPRDDIDAFLKGAQPKPKDGVEAMVNELSDLVDAMDKVNGWTPERRDRAILIARALKAERAAEIADEDRVLRAQALVLAGGSAAVKEEPAKALLEKDPFAGLQPPKGLTSPSTDETAEEMAKRRMGQAQDPLARQFKPPQAAQPTDSLIGKPFPRPATATQEPASPAPETSRKWTWPPWGTRYGWLWDAPSGAQGVAWSWMGLELAVVAGLWWAVLWWAKPLVPRMKSFAMEGLLRVPFAAVLAILVFPPWIVRRGPSPSLARHGCLWDPPWLAEGIAWGPLVLEVVLVGVLWVGLKRLKQPPTAGE